MECAVARGTVIGARKWAVAAACCAE